MAAAKRRGHNRLQSPAMAIPLLFFSSLLLYLIAWNAYISLENWSYTVRHPTIVWGQTYVHMFNDIFFRRAFTHSFLLSAGLVAVGNVLGLLLAGLLYFLPNTQRSVYLSIFLYPLAISMATNGLIWLWLFNPTFGVDWVLAQLHLPTIGWLNTGTSTFLSMFLVSVWAYTGLAVLFYLAAFMNVEKEVVEAARIDGAGGLRILFRILLPNSMNGFIVSTALLFLFAFRMFSLPFVMGGGPSNLFLMTLTEYVMYSFYVSMFSQSAAASVIIAAIAAAIVIPYALLGIKRWVVRG